MIHLFFWLFTIVSLVPFALIFMVSITDEDSIAMNGYSLFPSKISFAAYNFLFNDFSEIASAYGVTMITTVVGTAVSLLITALFAYPLSRSGLPFRRTLSFYIFPKIFSTLRKPIFKFIICITCSFSLPLHFFN